VGGLQHPGEITASIISRYDIARSLAIGTGCSLAIIPPMVA